MATHQVATSCLFLLLLVGHHQIMAQQTTEQHPNVTLEDLDHKMPANHRMELENTDEQVAGSPEHRRGRQYDGPLSSSGSGNYVASVSSDSGAYVGPAQQLGSNHRQSSIYLNGPNDYANTANYLHQDPMARGFIPAAYPSGPGYPSSAHIGPLLPGPGSPTSAFPSGSGSLLSGSSILPLMLAKGFDVTEVICSAIAVAIGAVIVGAPFILLYLFVMNQMGGNLNGQNGGTISLTGPSSSATVNGRKKRQASSFSEALFKQLSPLMNNEQLTNSFKSLMNSLAKYQV